MTTETIDPNKAIVRPSGDSIVAATLPELRSRLRAAIEDGARDIAIDLAAVRMVDSSGIGLLISAHNSMRKVGGRISICNASDELLDLFRTMRMHQHFQISIASGGRHE